MIEEYYTRRDIWKQKPHIRLVYQRWMDKIRPFLTCKPFLEVGSGSGLIKELEPDILISDTLSLPWLDVAADCMCLPFQKEQLGTVLSFDVLHHILDPHLFIEETAKVLKPGGRLILLEPFITPVSYFGYKLLHHEAVYFKDYHEPVEKEKDPWQGNLALPNLVFDRDLSRWDSLHPSMKIIHREKMSFIDFQCSGGFKPYSFMPYSIFKCLIHLDDWIRILMPFLGFRIFVVIEKV